MFSFKVTLDVLPRDGGPQMPPGKLSAWCISIHGGHQPKRSSTFQELIDCMEMPIPCQFHPLLAEMKARN